jgi:hypothetical protein
MSINGVSNPLLSNLGAVGRPAGGAQPAGTQPTGTQPGQLRPGAARPGVAPAPAALKPQTSLASPTTTLPAEAPAGTDPALWSVLTSAERTYFAKASSMGPLTYGRAAAGINAMPTGAPAVRGGRLDVRG